MQQRKDQIAAGGPVGQMGAATANLDDLDDLEEIADGDQGMPPGALHGGGYS